MNFCTLNTLIVFSIMVIVSHSSQCQQLPLISVSPDNTYLMTDDKAFLWIGDTSWELIHRCSREEIDFYLNDRASKGFNVIQTVILAELDGLNEPNAEGNTPLIENDPAKPREAYFELVDYVIEKSGQLGVYVALLPTWGDKFNKRWGVGPEIFSRENAFAYGSFLGKRYRKKTNIIWVMGGDRIPEEDEHYDIVNAMAAGIRESGAEQLMTYHPSGGSIASEYFKDSDWLDINMFQSGHSRLADEVDFVLRAKEAERPVINGESRYENIRDRFWEEELHGWLDDADVRISAYGSILAGAAGYSYGCNDIWQMYRADRDPVLNARTGWRAATDLPGAFHMGVLKHFFEHLPWYELVPDATLIESTEDAEFNPVAAIGVNKDFALIYLPTGQKVKPNLNPLKPAELYAFWFNPRSGAYKEIGIVDPQAGQTFEPWAKGWGSDFMLLIVSKPLRDKILNQ